ETRVSGILQHANAERSANVRLHRPSTAARLRRRRGRTPSLCFCPRRLLVVGFPAHAVLDAATPPMAGAGDLSSGVGGGRRRLARTWRFTVCAGMRRPTDLAPCRT